jgi:glycosyltransferase involved in cell wall biosynthesis/O-antigen/teichoic acid export membrane protein
MSEHDPIAVGAGISPAANAEDPTAILDSPEASGKLVRGGTLRVLGYIAGVLVSVIGAAVMIRHLGVVAFGRYTTVLSLITIVGALSDLGLTGVGTREYAVRSPVDRQRLLRNLLGMRLTMSALGVALMCAFGVIVGYPAVTIEGTALGGVTLLALVTQDTATIPLNASLRLGWTASLEFMRQVGTALVIVILAVAGATLLPFIAASIPVGVLVAAIAAGLVRSEVGLRPTFDRAQWRVMAIDVLPYAAASAMGAIYFRVEIVLLSVVSTAFQTGLFSAAFRITEVVVGVPWLVISSALPVLARSARTDRARLAVVLERMFQAAMVAGVGIALAMALGARFALDVVAGPGFHRSTGVLQIQAATVVGTFLVTLWGYALLALEQRRALVIINGAGLVCACVLTVVLGGTLSAAAARRRGPARAARCGRRDRGVRGARVAEPRRRSARDGDLRSPAVRAASRAAGGDVPAAGTPHRRSGRVRLAVYHDLPRAGGAPTVLAEVVRRLPGHEWELFTPQSASGPDLLGLDALFGARAVRPLPGGAPGAAGQYLRMLSLPWAGRRLAREIDAGGFDALWALPSVIVQAPEILPFLHTPSVYYAPEPLRAVYDEEQTLRDRVSPYQGVRRLLDRRDIAAADLVMTHSRFTAERLQQVYGVRAEVVPLGVDADAVAPGPGLGERAREVLSVGALHPLKGHELVIEAVAVLARDGEAPSVTIVGDRGEHGPALVALAERLGVRLEVLRAIPWAQVLARYRRAAVVACAAHGEPFGLSPLEAMAAGTPVVAVDEGGYRETVEDGVTGLRVARSAQALAGALGRLLGDGALWASLSAGGREAALRRWRWEETAAGVERLLASVARR